MKLSVVIPTFNRKLMLAAALDRLIRLTPCDVDYEIVVVVDGSADGTLEYLAEASIDLPLQIISQPNSGPGAARNAGIASSQGALVLFLDDDVLVDAGLLNRHLRAHEGQGDDLVAFGPVLIAPESPSTVATTWARRRTRASVGRLIERGPEWPTDAFVEANTSVSRSLLEAVGGYDAGVLHPREGLDLGLRLWAKGTRFEFLPDAVAHQVYGKSARVLVEDDAVRYGKAELQLARRYPRYRPRSSLARLKEGSAVKRTLRSIVAKHSRVLGAGAVVAAQGVEAIATHVSPAKDPGVRVVEFALGAQAFRGATTEVGSWEALHRDFGATLPALLYHHVGPTTPGTYPELTISPRKFEAHISWLARRGYTGIGPSRWLDWLRDAKPLPTKPVLISFDDAYADVCRYGLPILSRYEFGAVVYVATASVGGRDSWNATSAFHKCMSTNEISEWSRRGIEFGAHSRTHADLTKLSRRDMDAEINGSKSDLEAIVGKKVESFAYPYGYYTREIRDRVATAFELAFTAVPGLNTLLTDRSLLHRTMIQPSDVILDLELRLRFGWSPLERLRNRARVRSRLQSIMRLS